MSILSEIQGKLNAPKSQTNSFAKYNYRSAEDILQALKPLLTEYNCHIIITDDIVCVSERVYVKATSTIYHDEKVIGTATAFAREPIMKKGQDESQITGAASSYAR